VKRQKKYRGDRHPDALGSTENLAHVLSDKGQFEDAAKLFEAIIEQGGQVFGVSHPRTLLYRSLLGQNLTRQGRFNEAQEILEDVLAKQTSADRHPRVSSIAFTEERLACNYVEQGKTDQAALLLLSAIQRFSEEVGRGHPSTLACMRSLAQAYRRADRIDEAVEVESGITELGEQVPPVEDGDFNDVSMVLRLS
jgi:tetratricopeptide (TPR) repeat protein